jgi:hypothetical protein
MSLLSLCFSAVKKNGVQGYVRFKKEQRLFKIKSRFQDSFGYKNCKLLKKNESPKAVTFGLKLYVGL